MNITAFGLLGGSFVTRCFVFRPCDVPPLLSAGLSLAQDVPPFTYDLSDSSWDKVAAAHDSQAPARHMTLFSNCLLWS